MSWPRSWAELAAGAHLTLCHKTRQGCGEGRAESAQEMGRDTEHAERSKPLEQSCVGPRNHVEASPKVKLRCPQDGS